MRKIKFLGDTGNPITVEVSNDITVSQFITALTEAGGNFDLERNLLTEKKSRATFLVADAVLPNGDISLFSTIKDPKGNLSRADCYATIKNSGNTAFFNQGKNYTNKSTAELARLIDEFYTKEVQDPTVEGDLPKELTVNSLEDISGALVYSLSDDEGNLFFVSKSDIDSVVLNEDPEFVELLSYQRSFNPKTTRRE